ncbi:MAG: hypothetical protein JWQ45_1762 [Blastococcus sp.]|nr:hypothetical protein [Blastococcus sp.]
MAGETDRNALLRQLASALANVAVLTALLVYFGWVRISVQSRLLGLDESLFRVSTREYLLRSVRPVLILLICIAVAGLLWVALDRWLSGRLAAHGPADAAVRWAFGLLVSAVAVLPFGVWLAGYAWPTTAYVAFPLSAAAGLLLALYGLQLRLGLPGRAALSVSRDTVVRACAAVLTGICLFVAAANYATVEGSRLARAFVAGLPNQPRVVVYSAQHLHLDAPGVTEEGLAPEQSAYLFRYVGLRLLEHTESTYFLVSDGWKPDYGVVVVLPDDAPVRLEFVRDTRDN